MDRAGYPNVLCNTLFELTQPLYCKPLGAEFPGTSIVLTIKFG